MRLAIFAFITLVSLSGCSYIDWSGVWFGCPKGELKKRATIGMFGTVKAPSECKPVQWMKDNNYVVTCPDNPEMLCEKYGMGKVVGEDSAP
jgi:hypothetical protein